MSWFMKLALIGLMVGQAISQEPDETTTEIMPTSITNFCSDSVMKIREDRIISNFTIKGAPPKLTVGSTLLLVVILAVSANVVSLSFGKLQNWLYQDEPNLDTLFDAGGNNSMSLVADSVFCNRNGMTSLVFSSAIVLRYGIAGSYWYGVAAGIQLVMFSYLSIQFKTKCPGGITVTQFIREKYGFYPHIMFLCYGLFNNFTIFVALLVEATQTIDLIVENLMPEFSCMLLAILTGSYVIIGGLGGTFFVCYFNTIVLYALIIMLIFVVYFDPLEFDNNPLGNVTLFYELVTCNERSTFATNEKVLSFGSHLEWKFAAMIFFSKFGEIYLDMDSWQGTVATQPRNGVLSTILGGLMWMGISLALGTVGGLTYLGLEAAQETPILKDKDINNGLVLPVVVNEMMGGSGSFLLLTLILLAVMSTGSAEVIAISSYIIYDIYQVYVQPFKVNVPEGQCKLCGNNFEAKDEGAFKEEICCCTSISDCSDCQNDIAMKRKAEKAGSLVMPPYACEMHRDYKIYNDKLLKIANWCIVLCTIATVPVVWPLTSVANNFKLNLGTIFAVFFIAINSGVVPLCLGIVWSHATSSGLVAGSMAGLATGLLGWLITATSKPEGLTMDTAASDDPILVGHILATSISALVTVSVSLWKRPDRKELVDNENLAWKKTMSICNPLFPWKAKYKKYPHMHNEATQYADLPEHETFADNFKNWRIVSIAVSVGVFVALLIVLPLSLYSEEFSLNKFIFWLDFIFIWILVSTFVGVIIPLVEQILEIRHVLQQKQYESTADIASQQDSDISMILNTLEKKRNH